MMKRVQTALAACCALCLIMAMLLTGGVLAVSAAENVTLTLSNTTAPAGGVATVTLSMSQVQGWGAAAIHMTFDNTKMTCIEATPEGAIKTLDMPTAVIEPARAPSQVWLSGISAGSVAGEGQILTMKFQLHDDATGTLAFGFDEATTQMLTGQNELMNVTYVDGSVTIGGEPQPTQAPATQSSETAATQAVVPVTRADGTPETQADGTPVTQLVPDIAPETQPTTPSADTAFTMPANVQVPQGTVALAADAVKAAPGSVVTVMVGISQVSDLSGASIKISYDTSKMTCVEAKPVGFLADSANTVIHPDRAKNEVWLTQMSTSGISGSGAILELKFQLYSNAKGTIPLSFSGKQEMIDSNSNTIAVMPIDGSVTLEGTPIAGNDSPAGGGWWIYAIVAGVVIVLAIVLAVVIFRRRKQAQLLGMAQQAARQAQAQPEQPEQAQAQPEQSEQPKGSLDDDDEFRV